MNVETNQNYSQSLPYYKVLSEERDEKVDPSFMKVQDNIPSEEQAKDIASAYIQSHGGLPNDAIFKKVEQQHVQKVDYTNGQVVETYPLATEITYTREINGVQVVGPGDFIFISIGENGKVLCCLKTWRVLQRAGYTDLIPINDAVTKLERGEYMQMPLDQYRSPVTINEISPGYYSKAKGETQDFYKPVWIFTGTDSVGEIVQIYIDATAN